MNGDGGYGLLAAYIGGPAAQVGWLGPKVGGHLAPFLYSSREASELSQWLCYDDSTINTVAVIIIIMRKTRTSRNLLRTGISSCCVTNSARLHSIATRASAFHVGISLL